MATQRLAELRTIRGLIVVETGLRIGGSQETMEISGLDNPIIRNPRDNKPFIPGSSIKGRMRSLAEWYFNELPERGEVIRPQRGSTTARVFGVGAEKGDTRGPTRLIVRDALLCQEDRDAFDQHGRPLTEVKSENSINRLTSMANPRPMERVLPGVRFGLEIVYRVLDMDGDGGRGDRERFDSVVLTALALLQADGLGSGVSRGNGKIRLQDLTVNGATLTLPALTFAGGAASA